MNNYGSIVSPKWLQENLANPNVKIVDCRFRLSDSQWGYKQYLHSHILGAYYFDLERDLSSPKQKYGGRHPLPDLDLFASKLAQIGIIKDQTTVVAYDDFRFAFAARFWWLLGYLGHENVFLLNGGWNAWQKAHFPVTEVLPPKDLGNFQPQVKKHSLVDRETIIKTQYSRNSVLIDARSSERYRGETEPIDPIAGSIPGASNLCWQEITDNQGYFFPISTQKKLWQSYQDQDEIIVYCGSGVTACVNILSLAMCGIKGVKLYLGGWSDWCSYL